MSEIKDRLLSVRCLNFIPGSNWCRILFAFYLSRRFFHSLADGLSIQKDGKNVGLTFCLVFRLGDEKPLKPKIELF